MTPASILTYISQSLDVSLDALKGKSRNRDIVDKRHIAMYLIRKYCKFPRRGVQEPLSYEQIGWLFGDRNHCTVINAFRKIEYLIQVDKAIRQMVAPIDRHIASMAKTWDIVIQDNKICPHCGAVKEAE
jgi:chromosomal replication initiator protein